MTERRIFIKDDKFKVIRNDEAKIADLKGDLDEFIFDDCYSKTVSER